MDGHHRLKCIWVGPTTGGLGWLREKMRAWEFRGRKLSFVHESPTLERQSVEEAVAQGVDRIVLSCGERINYPTRAIAHLQQAYAEIPLAVATGSWWDGARRTGLGTVDHLLLPWYRWWDSWVDWLSATSAHLFGPCQLPPSLPGGRRWPVETTPARRVSGMLPGCVVANCGQTARAWMDVAMESGCQVDAMSPAAFQSHIGGCHPEHASRWVLWDDSCLDTTRGAEAAGEQLQSFFDELGKLRPEARGLAALSLPRHDSWKAIESMKPTNAIRELIAKPNSGSALHNCLAATCSEPTGC